MPAFRFGKSDFTKSGKLKTGARRAALGKVPKGAVVLMNKTKARSRGIKANKNAWVAEFGVKADFAVSLSPGALVQYVSWAVAEHYRASLYQNKRADTGRPLPQLAASTLDGTYGARVQGSFGVKTGQLAEKWMIGKLRWNYTSARQVIQPYTKDFRGVTISNWANRVGSDAVNIAPVGGDVDKVIEAAMQRFMDAAIASDESAIGHPANPVISAEYLDTARGELMSKYKF